MAPISASQCYDYMQKAEKLNYTATKQSRKCGSDMADDLPRPASGSCPKARQLIPSAGPQLSRGVGVGGLSHAGRKLPIAAGNDLLLQKL